MDHFQRDQVLTDIEMFDRTLGLCAPVTVRRNLDLPHAVRFCPEKLFFRHAVFLSAY